MIWREGWFIKYRAYLEIMNVFIGFIIPALDMISDEVNGAKDRY